jgi:transposase InsO family protein
MLSRFGCPRRIITDNVVAFKSKKLVKLCSYYGITLSHSTTYYPKGNGLAKSTNKGLIRIIKKYCKRKRNLCTKVDFCTLGRQGKNKEVYWYISIPSCLWWRCSFSHLTWVANHEAIAGSRC